ncbi:hypothetical protein [Rheinheimera baltica]|uniref:hypothetical protein n=1 Tax=Rheinheimera baltica TaxID=67576 RepID=UPI00273D4FF7|nr:hypothetical protein [Rheinheimera baltica]MDP5190046.1 hypothetical protein [Rheinheimera baltica]
MPDIIDILLVVQRVLLVFRVLLNPVFPPFNRLEMRVIEEIEKQIKPEFKSVYQEHLSLINFVQRDAGGRLARMYTWRFPGYYSWARKQYIEIEAGTVKLARFSLHFKCGDVIHGSLVSIDGVICNMSFGESLNLYKSAELLQIKIKPSLITS